MDIAELLPSWVLVQYLALRGVVSSGSELLRYLGEVVQFCVLSFRRGDARIVELGECRETGDRVE